jgi:hypothetical protein
MACSLRAFDNQRESVLAQIYKTTWYPSSGRKERDDSRKYSSILLLWRRHRVTGTARTSRGRRDDPIRTCNKGRGAHRRQPSPAGTSQSQLSFQVPVHDMYTTLPNYHWSNHRQSSIGKQTPLPTQSPLTYHACEVEGGKSNAYDVPFRQSCWAPKWPKVQRLCMKPEYSPTTSQPSTATLPVGGYHHS